MGQTNKDLQECANSWITPEFVKKLLKIINSNSKGIILESLGKLIIEITCKDTCYNLKSWQTIISGLLLHFSEVEENINLLSVAFIFRLIICCSNKMDHKYYNEEELRALSEIWTKFAPVFFLKDMGKLNFHVLGIVLLLKTVLKQKKEVILNQALLQILKANEKGKDPATMIDTFLRVSSLLNMDIPISKYCDSIIMHIISNGKEQDKKFEDFSKADLSASLPKLFTLCKTLPIGEQTLTFDNLFSIKNDEVNKPLLEQALGCQYFLVYTDADKMQSLSYYIKMLINLMVEHTQGIGVDLVQEKLLALLQYYFSFDCQQTLDLNRFVFLNAVSEMYILFADFLISTGENFTEKQAILEFSQMAAEHMLEIFDNLALSYFKCALNEKAMLPQKNLPKLLANAWLILGDAIGTMEKIGVKDIELEHISNIQLELALKEISNKISSEDLKQKDANQKAQHWAVSILESHIITHTSCRTRSELHYIEKAMISTIQLLTSLLPTCFRLFGATPQATKELVLKLFIKAEMPVFPDFIQESIRNSAIEMCKAIGLSQNLAVSVHHASNGLLQMSKITQFLNQIMELQVMEDEFLGKLIKLLLNKWKTSFQTAYSACTTEEVLNFAQQLAMHDLIKSIKSIYQLLNLSEIGPSINIQIINIIWECIERGDETLNAALQEITFAFDAQKIKEFLAIPEKESKFQALLTKFAKNNVPLQDKLYEILVKDLVNEDLAEKSCLYSRLNLLEGIVHSNKKRFISRLIEDLLAWAVCNKKNSRIQELLLDYFATICCKGLSVSYPKSGKSHNDLDIQDAELEGYGISNFTRKEESVKPGNYCTFLRTKKRFEIQPSYHCYTCNLVDSKGCCTLCAKTCHKGHNVLFWKNCSFYCDCHTEGRCKAMPREFEFSDSDENSHHMLVRHYIEQREREKEKERERENERLLMAEDSPDQNMEEWKERHSIFPRIIQNMRANQDSAENDDEREYIEKLIRLEKEDGSSDSDVQEPIRREQVESPVISDVPPKIIKQISLTPRDIPYESIISLLKMNRSIIYEAYNRVQA